MFVGIDVGGTFTDGVLINRSSLISSVKVPTGMDLTLSIVQTMERLLSNCDGSEIERVVVSTTLITNILATRKKLPIGLILVPGPGTNPGRFEFPGPAFTVQGSVDYRGRLTQPLKMNEIDRAVRSFQEQGITHVVAGSKFSQRNPVLENEICAYINKHYPDFVTLASHQVSGRLNWIRRTNGAVFSLFVNEAYQTFLEQVRSSFMKMGVTCPIHVLKADGGTIPFENASGFPLEAIYSGPVASTMGGMALAGTGLTSVIMDIGGTTTDLALILRDEPLFAQKGTWLNNFPIPTRALAISSLALGGDTAVTVNQNGEIGLSDRKGPALALGGPQVTISDLFVYLGLSGLATQMPFLRE